MNYRTEYSNHAHMLLVSVSKHIYILKNRTLKFQKKKMDYNLKNLTKADRELVIHYLIADHLSGVFYAEIHSSKKIIPIEEFLYRAWSKKEKFAFCGLPAMLSVPRTIKSDEVLNLLNSLGIEQVFPESGFHAGVKYIKKWEEMLRFSFISDFDRLQSKNVVICLHEFIGISPDESKLRFWMQNLKEVILPPPKEVFFSLCKKKSKKYPPVKFEIFPTEEGEELGEFFWGEERTKIEEKYLELLEDIEHGEVKGMFLSLQNISKEDPEFIGAFELMGHIEFLKRNIAKAIKHFKKAVEVGERIIPEGFKGHILNGVFENKYFLNSVQGLALCYLKTGDAAKALYCFARLVKYSPSYYNTLKTVIAEALLQYNDLERAKPIFFQDIHEASSAYNMGLILFKEENFIEAVNTLKTAFFGNPYIVEILVGNLELYRGSRFGVYITPYEEACEYVENNLRSWEADEKALNFLKTLYNHPLLNKDIKDALEIQKQLDNEKDYQTKRHLEKLVHSIMSRIDTISSQEIWKDLYSN